MTKPVLTEGGTERFRDLVKFGRHLKSSMDIDPLYPILRHVQRKMDKEEALWHSFLYVAWYHLPSGHLAYSMFPEPRDRRIYGKRTRKLGYSWPTGTERRNNRGGRVFDHIASFCQVTDHTDLDTWYQLGFVDDHGSRERRHANWRMLNERLQAIHGNGRWAAYKHCEVLRRVNGLRVEAPDMGHRFSSGPREGLATLYGPLEGQGEAVIAILDQQGVDLQRRLAHQQLAMDIEEVETLLCNWKSLLKGKYYVGHDIDENQEQIAKAYAAGLLDRRQHKELLLARRAMLPNHYLGELHDWEGIQARRMTAYRDRGVVVVRKV